MTVVEDAHRPILRAGHEPRPIGPEGECRDLGGVGDERPLDFPRPDVQEHEPPTPRAQDDRAPVGIEDGALDRERLHGQTAQEGARRRVPEYEHLVRRNESRQLERS